jgi:phosphate/phosphite/phosphonate ABC transporter binding protein
MHGLGPRLAIASALLALAGCPDDPATEAPEAPAAPRAIEGGTERPPALVIGLTPYLPEDKLRREYEPLVEYISGQLGIPVRIRRAQSYAAMSKLFTSHEVHFAVLSPFAYVRAKRENPDIILVATHIADGSSTYAGYIVTRDDTGFDNADALKGKRFLYVDRQSTSGYLYPLAYLRNLGHEPELFFGSVAFGGNHAAVLRKVLDREADAGAVASTVFKMTQAEAEDGRRLKIIAKTGRIPYDAYCASPHLDRTLISQLRSLLLGLSTRTEEGRRILRGLTAINGFVAVGDDHYDEVRRVARMVREQDTNAP